LHNSGAIRARRECWLARRKSPSRKPHKCGLDADEDSELV